MLLVRPRFHKLLIQELFKKLELFSVNLRERFSSTGAKYKNIKRDDFLFNFKKEYHIPLHRNKYVKNLFSKR